MNTIERVARAIEPYIKEAANITVTNTGPFLVNTFNVVSADKTSLPPRAAKAALEALCEGLEWDGNYLMLDGVAIGSVNKVLGGEWVGGLGLRRPMVLCEKNRSIAKFKLMSRARNWIMGAEA